MNIVHFEETELVVQRLSGSSEQQHAQVQRLIAWRIQHGLLPERHRTFGIHYDDPRLTPTDQIRVDAGIEIFGAPPPLIEGLRHMHIPAGPCATTRHIGPRDKIFAAAALHDDWLPASGKRRRDFPIFFHYVNVGPGIAEAEMITDVYLPII